ncbi:hypothetical protein MATR_21260 [Marivirga tractuosa]|uniref:Uncharacterized protein n=1 Tax=Marivirga tractuosa (strain ATCC 23168 / DSM 4126 / NBRC 15989 / NCIMB 1408 / VKM B-1430 / H-43) TaxID=643867 RepID=E4TLW7_MARTH|nr:hypothetical protein [Marivirga tractuosa]ADR20258.1 hypothetical protein Ftrac_0247 [Marivirga tractuosa DSM 4126]BDD15301.1 hypothetical protein MATR_21260 [Marivirga tractuosa]
MRIFLIIIFLGCSYISSAQVNLYNLKVTEVINNEGDVEDLGIEFMVSDVNQINSVVITLNLDGEKVDDYIFIKNVIDNNLVLVRDENTSFFDGHQITILLVGKNEILPTYDKLQLSAVTIDGKQSNTLTFRLTE